MAHYPDQHFISEFAKRTLANFEAMRAGKELVGHDTALISFLLAVFVLPYERSEQDNYMVELLKSYQTPLEEVVEILRERSCDPADRAGEPLTSLKQLPRYLRNAVAHFNIRPESTDGQNLTQLLIWNRVPESYGKNAGKITFVARVNIDELRGLAIHVLEQLAQTNVADRYEATDPITKFDNDWKA